MPPVRTSVVDTHEVDVAGISAVLSRFSNRIQLVADPPGPGVDVILYGVREQQPGHDAELHALLRTHAATVIALGWSGDTPQAQWALSCGAQAHLSKTLTGHELVARVEQVHRVHGRPRDLPADGHCHPAVRAAGLTSRELQVMALVARGLTNQEIADRTYLSVNSVKTYVRTAYRKLDISRRSQAVSWGIQHGLDVEPTGEATVQAELEPSL